MSSRENSNPARVVDDTKALHQIPLQSVQISPFRRQIVCHTPRRDWRRLKSKTFEFDSQARIVLRLESLEYFCMSQAASMRFLPNLQVFVVSHNSPRPSA